MLIAHLNDYFAAVQDVLRQHGGHFVKAPGDCVVAWFAEDGNRIPHRQRAITAARNRLQGETTDDGE